MPKKRKAAATTDGLNQDTMTPRERYLYNYIKEYTGNTPVEIYTMSQLLDRVIVILERCAFGRDDLKLFLDADLRVLTIENDKWCLQFSQDGDTDAG